MTIVTGITTIWIKPSTSTPSYHYCHVKFLMLKVPSLGLILKCLIGNHIITNCFNLDVHDHDHHCHWNHHHQKCWKCFLKCLIEHHSITYSTKCDVHCTLYRAPKGPWVLGPLVGNASNPDHIVPVRGQNLNHLDHHDHHVKGEHLQSPITTINSQCNIPVPFFNHQFVFQLHTYRGSIFVNTNFSSYWVSQAGGANYPAMEFIGPVLPEVSVFLSPCLWWEKIQDHWQNWADELHGWVVSFLHWQYWPSSWKNTGYFPKYPVFHPPGISMILNFSSYWVSVATGANYPAMEFIGPVLPEVSIS